MKQLTRRVFTGCLATAAALSLASCGGGATPQPSQAPAADEKVEITIGNQPAATEAQKRALFDAEIEAYRKKYPNVTVKVTEEGWDAQTFAARLASGSLPTVLGVPFTEISGLISRGQVADITQPITDLKVLEQLNPELLRLVAKDGHYFGVPTSAYAMGLIYNRALFTQAGLDPDKPPATWDEVRAAAKAITTKLSVPGMARISTNNQGGWVLGTEVASRGGSLVNADGTQVAFDADPAKEALSLLHAMRWEDKSLSPNGLLDANGLAQEFAAGKVGMFILQSDAYQPLTQLLKFPAANFGFAAMPTVKAGDAPVTLSGGNIDIVSPKASAGQARAAVQWIQFHQLARFTDEAAAKADAEASVKQGTAVAVPGIPVITADRYQQYLTWIAAINNVPAASFKPYLDRAAQQKIVAEPPLHGQEIYASLDPVVQAVITQENADIAALLKDAATKAQATLSR